MKTAHRNSAQAKHRFQADPIAAIYIELQQESETERADREAFARAMDVARLQGRLEAFAMALTECSRTARRDGGSVGARDCSEIRQAIDILHLDTLRQMKMANNARRKAT